MARVLQKSEGSHGDAPRTSTVSIFRELLIPGASLAMILAVTGYRLHAVREANFPGPSDKAFYFNVAENIAAGRGPNIDYVWHFLVPQDHLTHFAFDYWMPLHSVLIAVPLWLFGGGVPTALSVGVLLAAVFALATVAIARSLTDVRWIPWIAAAVVVLLPPVTFFSVESESSISYWAIGALTFAAAFRARTRPRLWLVAGALASLSHLTRNDGALLAAAVVACAFVWSPPRVRFWRAGAATAAYVAVLLPYAVLSMMKLGSPLPTASRIFPFITTHEDLYRTEPLPGIADLRSLGLRGNLNLRLDALIARWSDVLQQTSPIVITALLVLAGTAIGHAWQRRKDPWWHSPWLLPAVYGLAFAVVHVVVTPVVSASGGFVKSVTLLMPFLVIAALIGASRLTATPVAAAGLIALLLIPSAAQLSSTTRSIVEANNHAVDSVALGPILEKEAACVTGEIVVMTRRPWEFTAATKIRSVQIPNEPLPVILEEADRWGVTHLLQSELRSQLRNLDARGRGRFELVSAQMPSGPRGAFYRLRTPRTARCLAP